MLKITSNIDQIAKELAVLGDPVRMAKATSTALTRTAKVAQQEIQKAMPRVFDRPTPFTIKSVMIEPATASRLESRVFIRDEAFKGTAPVNYLSPQAHGGARKQKRFERQLQSAGLLPHGMFAVPGRAAKLDSYGNWDRGQIVQVLSYLQAFGEQGYRSNMNQKRQHRFTNKQGKMYFVGEAGKRGQLGIWEVVRFPGKSVIRPIALFVKAPGYRARFDFGKLADDVARRELPVQVVRAVDQALARMKSR